MSPIKPSSAVPTYPAHNAPRSLHFLSIFFFALQTVLFVSLSWVKTTHTSQATLSVSSPPKLFQSRVLFLSKTCPPKCTHPHKHTKNQTHSRSKRTPSMRDEAEHEEKGNSKAKTDLSAVCGALC